MLWPHTIPTMGPPTKICLTDHKWWCGAARFLHCNYARAQHSVQTHVLLENYLWSNPARGQEKSHRLTEALRVVHAATEGPFEGYEVALRELRQPEYPTDTQQITCQSLQLLVYDERHANGLQPTCKWVAAHKVYGACSTNGASAVHPAIETRQQDLNTGCSKFAR